MPDPKGGPGRTRRHPGAEVHDPDRRVTYRVSVGVRDGRAVVRTLEIEPDDDTTPVDVAMLRVPVDALARFVQVFLAEHESAGGGFFMVRPGGISLPDDVPTPEEIAALRSRGVSREDIAKQYSRSLSTVDDWIGRAYREVPDLMPPRRRGPRPKTSEPTTGPDQPDGPTAGHDTEGAQP